MKVSTNYNTIGNFTFTNIIHIYFVKQGTLLVKTEIEQEENKKN